MIENSAWSGIASMTPMASMRRRPRLSQAQPLRDVWGGSPTAASGTGVVEPGAVFAGLAVGCPRSGTGAGTGWGRMVEDSPSDASISVSAEGEWGGASAGARARTVSISRNSQLAVANSSSSAPRTHCSMSLVSSESSRSQRSTRRANRRNSGMAISPTVSRTSGRSRAESSENMAGSARTRGDEVTSPRLYRLRRRGGTVPRPLVPGRCGGENLAPAARRSTAIRHPVVASRSGLDNSSSVWLFCA